MIGQPWLGFNGSVHIVRILLAVKFGVDACDMDVSEPEAVHCLCSAAWCISYVPEFFFAM